MDIHIIILGASIILIFSFLFNLVSSKTNIPTVLMLMLLGFGIKFLFPLSQEELMPLLKLLGTVGVILIVLEASLDIKLSQETWPILGKALGLALLLLIFTTLIIAGALYTILDMEVFPALIYAVPLSVMSSAIIIPSVGSLVPHKKEFLIFESALSDILGIVIFYALIDIHHASPGSNIGIDLTFKFILTIVLSFILSYALIALFYRISSHTKLFLLIGTLMGLYALGKLLHLSSLIEIMVFGLLLANQNFFFRGKLKKLIDEENPVFKRTVHEFHTLTLETAFVVRTFFFVAFGMSISLSQLLHWTVPVITIIVLFAIYLTRFIGLRTTFASDIYPEIYVAPRGLITVLLFYAIPTDLQEEKFAPGILLLTILITSFVMTYGLIQQKRKAKRAEQQNPIQPAEPETIEVEAIVVDSGQASTEASNDL